MTAALANALSALERTTEGRDEADEPATRSGRRLRAPGLRFALSLAVVAALVVAAILGRQALIERSRAQDRADALAAARQVAANFSTLDYRTFAQDTARVSAESTGAFRSDFAAQAAQIKQVVVSDKSVSTGTVGQVALVSITAKTARALVVLDANVTNTSSTTPTARHYRVQLDLTKVGGRWLASQLEFVG
jgi:Mce-associated membrane protein